MCVMLKGMVGCSSKSQTAASVFYFVFFAITTLVSWLLRDYATEALKHIPYIRTCFDQQVSGTPGVCVGKGAVLRVSFGNFIFFAAHALVLLGCRSKSDRRKYIHSGCFFLQLLAWAAAIGSTFAMPNNVFYVWGEIARALGGLFLVIQVILVLDFIFVINTYLLEREHCKFLLIFGSLLLYFGSVAFCGLACYYYVPQISCRLNIYFITFTMVGGLVTTVFSLTPFRMKGSGLLTAGMIFAYGVFLLWSALGSEPTEDTCAIHTSSGEHRSIAIAGFAIALLSVVLATFFASTEASSFNIGKRDDEDLDYRPDFFHFVYALASAYVAMLLLAWSLEDIPGQFSVDKGWVSCWIHMATQWFTYVLYLWMLLAPRLLKGRSFDDE